MTGERDRLDVPDWADLDRLHAEEVLTTEAMPSETSVLTPDTDTDPPDVPVQDTVNDQANVQPKPPDQNKRGGLTDTDTAPPAYRYRILRMTDQFPRTNKGPVARCSMAIPRRRPR